MKYPGKRHVIRINGEPWQLYVISGCQRTEEVDWAAKTIPTEKVILFWEDFLSFGVVAHELFHAYSAYFHLHSSNVQMRDYEEIVADFLEKRLDTFHKHAKEVWRQVR